MYSRRDSLPFLVAWRGFSHFGGRVREKTRGIYISYSRRFSSGVCAIGRGFCISRRIWAKKCALCTFRTVGVYIPYSWARSAWGGRGQRVGRYTFCIARSMYHHTPPLFIYKPPYDYITPTYSPIQFSCKKREPPRGGHEGIVRTRDRVLQQKVGRVQIWHSDIIARLLWGIKCFGENC